MQIMLNNIPKVMQKLNQYASYNKEQNKSLFILMKILISL